MKEGINTFKVEGDAIGLNVSGSRNIIAKDSTITVNEIQHYGLNILSLNYFTEYISTEQDLEEWKNGFSFKLEAIKDKKEFRRNIVDIIKVKLEREHKVLLVGETGTSKTTILMELICDYFDEGYLLQDFQTLKSLLKRD